MFLGERVGFVAVSGETAAVVDVEVLVAVAIAVVGVGVGVEEMLWTRRLRRV